MKKIIKGIKVLFLIAIVALVMVALFKEFTGKRRSPLVSYSTSYGGDMQGSYSHLGIKKTDEETARIVYKHSPWHYQDNEVREYDVPIAVLKEIETLYDKHHIYRYENFPKSPLIVYDAGTTSYHFSMADDQDCSFSSGQVISQNAYAVLKEVNGVLENAMNQYQPLPGLVMKEQNENEYYHYTEGKVTIEVYEYSEGYLHYRYGNGTDQGISMKEDVVIYRVENGEEIEIARTNGYLMYDIPVCRTEEAYLPIEGRLEAGTYRIRTGEYSSDFEIR